VRSTTETSTVGTLKDIPVNLLFNAGKTLPTACTIIKTNKTQLFCSKNINKQSQIEEKGMYTFTS
jgi:hypothetical protein